MLTDLAAELLGYASMPVTVHRSTLDATAEQFAANREAMLAKLAALDAEHAKARRRRRREVRRPAPRRAASCCPASGSSCCSTPSAPFLELSPLAGWGCDFAVGAQRGHRHRRGRGRRVHDDRQRPDRAGRREQPVDGEEDCSGPRRSPRENRLPTINLVESGGADLPTQKEIFIPGGAALPRPHPALGAPASRPSRWCSATPPPAAPTCPA